jgi:hypothetical protein
MQFTPGSSTCGSRNATTKRQQKSGVSTFVLNYFVAKIDQQRRTPTPWPLGASVDVILYDAA